MPGLPPQQSPRPGLVPSKTLRPAVGYPTLAGSHNGSLPRVGAPSFTPTDPSAFYIDPIDATFDTVAASAPADGGSSSFTGTATFDTTVGDAPAAGGSSSFTGTAVFDTVAGNAPADGGSTTFNVSVSFDTTVGNAPADGGSTSFTGTATFTTTAGDAPAAGGDVDDATLRESFELNFYGHQRVAQNAVRIMLAQGTGGCLLFNVSKQAVNPGPNFGPYGLPKAATLLLVRQYAVDYGAEGIRSNGVNADRIRSGLLTSDFVKERAKARGVSEKDYMSGNLLGREVTAEDVAQAFLAQALALKTTADITTVDGGNIAAALR